MLVPLGFCSSSRGLRLLLFGLHAVGQFLLIERDIVHHLERMDALVKAGEHVLHPGVVLSTNVEKQVCVLHANDVLTRRVEGVHLLAGLQQHGHAGVCARCNLACKVVAGKHGGNNRDSVGSRCGWLRRAGGKGRQ
ncbi:hypothetical protein SDC9_133716 [bioreactor metagenome]|uniref:Uncharacterized protein n=1 Tax=bioreactor metagenome TaxID=1076179 RepID=A0A645DB19_9ZZZZ